MRRLSMEICCLLLLVPWLLQSEPNRSWDSLVQTVKVGKKVVVTKTNLAKIEGKLLSIDSQEVKVEWKGNPELIKRADVYRFRYADIRARRAGWGALIGLGAGFAIGAAAAQDSDVHAGIVGAAFALPGVGIGAGAGAALPIGEPLYEAERPPTATARSVPEQPAAVHEAAP